MIDRVDPGPSSGILDSGRDGFGSPGGGIVDAILYWWNEEEEDEVCRKSRSTRWQQLCLEALVIVPGIAIESDRGSDDK
jgi:hypothetical protein